MKETFKRLLKEDTREKYAKIPNKSLSKEDVVAILSYAYSTWIRNGHAEIQGFEGTPELKYPELTLVPARGYREDFYKTLGNYSNMSKTDVFYAALNFLKRIESNMGESYISEADIDFENPDDEAPKTATSRISEGMYSVRFNLQAGEKKGWWEVINPQGKTKYLNPANGSLMMTDCRLYNDASGAEAIMGGKSKFRTAWIECRHVKTIQICEATEQMGVDCQEYENLAQESPSQIPTFIESGNRASALMYNPRVAAHWTLDGRNVDDKKFKTILTLYKQCYIL